MRVFVTGATGFIGTAVVRELIAAGHQVLGLCRSEEKVAALAATGAEVHRGSIEDLDSLAAGAAQADGVIHLAFNHDFSRFARNCADDRQVIATLGAALAGSNRPLIVTSGTAIAVATDGQPATESAPAVPSEMFARAASEEAAAAARAAGASVSIVRLPQVHDRTRQGLVTYLIAIARQKGVLGYLGEGRVRWPAAPVADVARLYRLALERAQDGAIYHAVAEEGVSHRDIVDSLGRRLDLPTRRLAEGEAQDYFGWMAMFVSHDMPASSAWTRATLGWEPTGPGLLDDLAHLDLTAV